MIPSTQRPSHFERLFVSRLCALPLLAVCVASILPQAWAAAAPTTSTLTVTSGTTAVTSVAAGTVVTLTATVVSGSTPVNPGQVRFCVATAAHCEDSALLATAQLTTAGIATYKFRPGIGSHSYQAVFVGTSSYVKSTSTAAALTVTGLFPTTTTIASSGSIGNYTLTSTVVGMGSALPLRGNVRSSTRRTATPRWAQQYSRQPGRALRPPPYLLPATSPSTSRWATSTGTESLIWRHAIRAATR